MKKSLSIILGMPKGKPSDESEDLYGDEKAAAGKALAAAIKGGDGAEIAAAFETLLESCQGGEPESDESEED